MYSFRYEESEMWAVWPNDRSLSAFNDSSSKIVISQICHQLLDGVREQLNDLKDKMQNRKSLLTSKINNLLTALENFRADAQTNEIFARYFLPKHRNLQRFLCSGSKKSY